MAGRSRVRDVELTEAGDLSWDYCLVYTKREDQPDLHAARRVVIKKLKKAGLLVAEMKGHGEVFVLVTASIERFEREAERESIEMRLQDKFKDPKTGSAGYEEFRIENKHRFEGANKPRFFTSLERQRLLYAIFETKKKFGGCGLNVDELKPQLFSSIFPLTDEESIAELNQIWVRSVRSQPLNSIRDYFGEKIAMYFAFLGNYTLWLFFLSIFGMIAQGLQWYTHDADHPIIPVYCVILCLWTTLFLEHWKREQSVQAFLWDVQDFEEEERIRPEYVGDTSKGMWVGHYFIPASDIPKEDVAQNLGETVYFPSWKRVLRYMVSAPVIGSFVIATVAGTVAILVARGVWALPADAGGYGKMGQIAGGMVNAMFITFMNIVYKKVAVVLNNFENHRTDTDYEDQLIGKVFLFQFINSYISLFYIAFIKGHDISIMGMHSLPCRNSCLDEMSTQLLSLVVIMQIIGNCKEIGIPFVMSRVKMLMAARKKRAGVEEDAEIVPDTKYEYQSKLAQYPSTFDDYNEMAIQFGYVTLFAAAFPFASFASFLNNIIEIRSDAYKLLNHTQRPFYMGCEDIGSWEKVFSVVSTLAVITNVCIVGFTSNILSGKCEFVADLGNFFAGDSFRALHEGYGKKIDGVVYTAECENTGHNVCCPVVIPEGSTTNIVEPVKSTLFLSDYDVLLVVVICEHALLFIRFILAELIPDTPTWVVKAQARIDIQKGESEAAKKSMEQDEDDEWSDTPDPEPKEGDFLEPKEDDYQSLKKDE